MDKIYLVKIENIRGEETILPRYFSCMATAKQAALDYMTETATKTDSEGNVCITYYSNIKQAKIIELEEGF